MLKYLEGNSVASLTRPQQIVVLVAGLVGAFASVALLQSELGVLSAPEQRLGCDINSLVTCAKSLGSAQGHVLGVPNSVLGIIAFTALSVIALLELLGTQIPRIVGLGVALGCAAGFGAIGWFIYVSVVQLGVLCPYCMVTWSAAIWVGCIWVPRAFEPNPNARLLRGYWWLTGIALHLVVILVLVLTMMDKIQALL